MAGLDVIKEIIEFENFFGENGSDTVLRGEYLIPDTHPDVYKILSVDVKPVITNKEVEQDRILVEGQVEYSVIYLAREEEGLGANQVTYTDKLSNFVDIAGAEHRMVCDAQCELEHINVNIINERKISIESYLRTKCHVSKNESFEFVKDIEGTGDLQSKKKPDKLEKLICSKEINLPAKTELKVGMDKPQIGKVLKYNVLLHKKDVKVSEDKLQVSCFCKIEVVYRAHQSRELVVLEDDVYITKDEGIVGLTSEMTPVFDFSLTNAEYRVVQDDLGEARIVDVEAIIDASVRVYKTEEIEVLDDAYSPVKNMELKKDKYTMVNMLGQKVNETIVKDNIYLDESDPDPIQIISVDGKVSALEKKILDNKVLLEGILKVDVIYKCSDEEKYLAKITSEIPFNSSVDIQHSKEGMHCDVKGYLDNIQASIEAHTIAIKAVVCTNAKFKCVVEKQYIKEVEEKEGEKPTKDASIIIYVIQKGDTLWDLAKKYNTTMDELANINSIENLEGLSAGEKIIIPGRAII